MTIFYPTSTKKLNDVVELAIDSTNIGNIDLLTVQNQTGQIYKIKLAQIGKYLSISYDSIISNSQTQFIVGRYSSGPGNLQEISVGDNISLNYDTGLLDCNLELVGDAGGVLEGAFPNPQLKEKVLEPKHLSAIPSNSIIGRASLEEGIPELIALGPEFDLDEETKTIRIINTSNKLVDTGFITEIKRDGLDFVALPTKLYLISSELDVTIDATEFGNLKTGSQFIAINQGIGNVNIAIKEGFISMLDLELNTIHILSDGEGNIILM